ncbi:hypothetical protein F2P81_008326 [Scophthalmus maximus]|uniref:Uncharacterized protein n=1 Tax=Scophthalmus maximus TaxID=52904 RepID=A0A6A4TAY8_SCOMX|nr:hypothetical protein F2P81_008326 [Scophthalmus maximus]
MEEMEGKQRAMERRMEKQIGMQGRRMEEEGSGKWKSQDEYPPIMVEPGSGGQMPPSGHIVLISASNGVYDS